MKTAFKKSNQQIELREVEPRKLRNGEVRIEVECCGICGSDLHGGTPEGEIFGHEIAGTVSELAPDVSGFEIGQRVVLESSSFCSRCGSCRNGNVEFCTNIRSFNQLDNVSLGFSESMIAPVESVLPYSGLTPEIACLQEPLGVAIDVVRVADIRPNQNVLLIGAGPIGLMVLEIIRNTVNAGSVYVSEFKTQTARYRLASEIGFTQWIEPAELADFTFGRNIDRVIVTAPPAAVPGALKIGGVGSRVTYIGVGWTPERSNQTLDLDSIHFRKQVLAPSYACPALFGPLALDYLKRGIVRGKRNISHRFSLNEMQKAMDAAHSAEAVKVVVHVR